MLRPLVVLWLATEVPPDAEAALAARLAAIEARAVSPSAAPAASDGQAAASEIEELLEAARAATPESGATFRRVDELLRAHPELPQAAWLMAERQALEAQLLLNRGTPEATAAAAAELLESARHLEGSRARALGLPSSILDGSPAAATQMTAEVRAPRADDIVFVDGRQKRHAAFVSAGLHHVRHFRANKALSSRWLEIGAEGVLELDDPAKPCDELDLAGVVAQVAGPSVPAGVLCERWAAARVDAAGSAALAFCQRESCGTWTPLRSDSGAIASAAGEPGNSPVADGSPQALTWLTWSALGVAALATTGVILWQTGAFERNPPSTQFVFTGPGTAAIRF